MNPGEGTLEWTILESSLDGFCIVDPEQRIARANLALCQLLDYSAQQLCRLSVENIEAPQNGGTNLVSWSRNRAGKRFSTRLVNRHGTLIDVEASVTPVESNDGHFGVFFRDLTNHRALAEKNRFIESILHTSPDFLYIYDLLEQRNVYMSDLEGLALGYTPQEYQAMGSQVLSQLMQPDDFSTYLSTTVPQYSTLDNDQVLTTRYRMKHKDGAWRYVQSRERVHRRTLDGRPEQIVGLLQDRTLEAEGALALSESQSRYATLFEHMESGFALYRARLSDHGEVQDFVYSEVNPAYETITGWGPGSLIGKGVLETDLHDGRIRFELYQQVLESGRGTHGEYFSVRNKKWYSVHCFCPQKGDVAAIVRDVTERKQMEARLAENQRQLNLIFNNTGTANSIFDQNCCLVRVNALSAAQLGLSEVEAQGKHVTELFGEVRGQIVEERMRQVLSSAQPRSFDTTFDLATGRATFRSVYQPILEGERVIGIQIISQDISEQVRAMAAQRESEALFAAFFDLAPDMVCIVDLGGAVLAMNPAGGALLGYEAPQMISRNFLDFVDPVDLERTRERWTAAMSEHNIVFSFENRCLTATGQSVSLEWVARIHNEKGQIYAMARDVTERRKAEKEKVALDEQVRKSQRLESLGILAGGIAHDFNNILAAILGFTEVAGLKSSEPGVQAPLARIREGCQRAQSLTRQLLTFSKGGAPHRTAVDLGPLVENTVQFASHGSSATVTTHVESPLKPVWCDPEQITQVVSNLVINALQALPEGGSVDVWVVQEAEGVVCRVHDTGTGIAPEVLELIFDPFYTTKPTGTGLGLSICHSIVRQHSGTLSVQSEVGKGSTFSLWLPLAIQAPTPVDLRPVPRHLGGGVAIVIDDEESIRASVGPLLVSFGYQVELASGVAAGQAAFRPLDRVTLGLLDLTLPGDQGGVALARTLRNSGFEGRLVAMSGYADDPVLAHPERFGFDAALAKPFTLETLSQTLQRATTRSELPG